MKFRKVLILISGSVLYLSLPILLSPDFGKGKNLFLIPPFQNQFIFYVFTLVLFFFNYYILLPKYFNPSSRLKYIFIIFASYILICTISLLTENRNPPPPPEFHSKNHLEPAGKKISMPFGEPPPMPENPNFPDKPLWKIIISEKTILYTLVITFSISLFLYNRWKNEITSKLFTENKYLRSQIEPHFFFNSLNSILSLVVTKSDNAPNAIVKMGDLMRYVLVESSKEQVLLEKEINYISTYVDFQKTRFSNIINIYFNLNIPENHLEIVPLILIPFVENAFKYGINGPETSIEINIELIDTKLSLKTKNRIFKSNQESSGIGIENARKRLEFGYPKNYELEIIEDQEIFIINLSINLNND